MKRFLAVLVASAMALSFAACSKGGDSSSQGDSQQQTSQGDSAQGDTANDSASSGDNAVAVSGKVLYSNGGPQEFFETPWLNPGSFTYNKVLYDRLLVADNNLIAIPDEGQLAQSYSLSEDGTTLEMTLRDGITWHDGDPITADDIKWNIEYSLKTTLLNSVFQGTFKAIEGAEQYIDGSAENISGITVDGNKITIKFAKVAPDALLTFTQFAPLPSKYFKDVDPLKFQQATFFQNPVGSGPFKVKEVKMNNYAILEAFDGYWNGAADFSIYLTPSAGDSDANIVTNAKAGKVDYAYTKSIADIKALEGVEGLNITQVDVRYTRLLYPNKFSKPDGSPSPLADPKVRQAIMYALDMDAILDGIFEGAAIPANSLTPDGGSKAEGLESYSYDPEKAKQLLQEANWDPNTVLDVVYYYTDQQTVDLMTIIQNYLAQVGIKMNFRLVEGDLATLLWKPADDPANGPSAVEWDMAYAAIAALSMHEYYDRFRSGSPINSHTPSDATLDALIDKTNSSMDAEVQKEAFFELQKYENENLFCLPLYYQPIFLITSDKIVEGATTIGNPQYNYNWDIQNWKLAE